MEKFWPWLKKNRNIDQPEENIISGEWFAKNQIPMVVACTSCGTTMCAPSALIDEEGMTYCSTCAGED